MFRRYGQLQPVLLCCLAIHVVAPIGMLLFVMPGFDLGGSAAERRAAYVAARRIRKLERVPGWRLLTGHRYAARSMDRRLLPLHLVAVSLAGWLDLPP